MNKCRILISLFFFFISANILQSQCDAFKIEEDYFADNLIGFYLSSIDVNTGDTSVEYFRYRILKNFSVSNLEAHFSLIINSPDLGLYDFELMSGIIDISNIVVPEIVFSNLDLNFSSDGVAGADFSVQESNFASNTDLESIQNIILSSGKIPNGIYKFTVTLMSDNDPDCDDIYDSIEKVVEAYEPVYLDLISPGGSIHDTSATMALSQFPLFTWNSDYCSQCNFGIRVCEYDPMKHSSLSDAIEDVSNIPIDQNEDYYPLISTQNFQYPPDDAIDLLPGNLYVWQIRRNFETTLGEAEDLSEIFVFKILSTEDIANENDDDPYEDLLKELLGYKYDEYFNPDGQLNDYFVKGSTIKINDEVVPISTLYDLINQLDSGEISIIEITIE